MRPITRVREKLKLRAEIFNCSYQTAWEKYMTSGEKERLEIDDVLDESMRPKEKRPCQKSR